MNVKNIRSSILSKMQAESKQKYFQNKYNLEPKTDTKALPECEDDIYSDLGTFLKDQTLASV